MIRTASQQRHQGISGKDGSEKRVQKSEHDYPAPIATAFARQHALTLSLLRTHMHARQYKNFHEQEASQKN